MRKLILIFLLFISVSVKCQLLFNLGESVVLDNIIRVDTIDTTSSFFGSYIDADYVFATNFNDGSLTEGVYAYSNNGNGLLTSIDTLINNNRNFKEIYYNGTYIGANSTTNGFSIMSFDGSTITEEDAEASSYSNGGGGIFWDGTHWHITRGNSGLRALSNSTTISVIASIDNGSSYDGISGDGAGTIVVGCYNDSLRAYSYNGSAYDYITGYRTSTSEYRGVYYHSGFYYVTMGDSVSSFSFDGADFTYISSIDSARSWHVSGYNNHLITTDGTEIALYYINNGYFTFYDKISVPIWNFRISMYGNVIICPNSDNGIKTFKLE